MRSIRYAASMLAATFLISACGGNTALTPTLPPIATLAAAAATTSLPTIAATTAPTTVSTTVPTGAPTTGATTAPTGDPSAAVLPAPFYALIRGQIERIERDGTMQTKITNEPSDGAALAIVDLAVSPDGSELVYQTQKPEGGSALIRTDANGGQRTVLYDSPTEGVGNPVWSPDGTSVAASVVPSSQDIIGGGGIYLLPIDGGEPKLLQSNSVVSATNSIDSLDPNDVGYLPISFSPDGTHILVNRYSLQVEQCGLAIIPVDGGETVLINPPSADLRTTCASATWSADGSSIYTSFTETGGPYSAVAGLWRVEASTGAATPLVPAQADGKAVLINGLFTLNDNELVGLIGSADSVPMIGEGGDVAYQVARISTSNGDRTFLSDTTYPGAQFSWSPDSSGALVQTTGNDGLTTVVWLPLDGGPSQPITAAVDLSGVKWGRP